MSNNALAINAMNFMQDTSMYNNPYLMQDTSMYNNPYFIAAYNSVNANAANQYNNQLPQAQQNWQNNVTNPVTFQGAPSPKVTTDKSNHGAAIALTATVAAISAGACILSRGKSAGAKGIVNQFKAGLKSFGKNNSEKTCMYMVNGKPVFTIPNKTQTLHPKEGNIVDKANKLGLTVNEGLQWTDKTAKIKGYHLEFKNGAEPIRVTVRDGKVVGCRQGKTNFNLDAEENKEIKKQINDAIEAVQSKKEPTSANIELKNIVYGKEITSGSQALYLGNHSNAGLRVIKTNRLDVDSDAVVYLRSNNKKFNEFVEKLEKGEIEFESMQVASAQYVPTNVAEPKYRKNTWVDGTTLNIENGQVVSVKFKDGKVSKAGEETFEALKADFPELFETAPQQTKEFLHPRYVVAA